MKTLDEIINTAIENRVSDIHIACNVPIKYRIDGQLQSLDDYVLTYDDCEALGKQVAGDRFDEIKDKGEIDLALTIGQARTRLSVFRAKGAISISLRITFSTAFLLASIISCPLMPNLVSIRCNNSL